MKTLPHSRPTAIAFAMAQMFALSCAHAQNADNVLPAVEVSASTPTGKGIAGIGSFSDTPLREVPAAISVITHEQMQDRSIRSATDAVKYDASVQNSYNAVGLSDWFAIRGFTLDQGSSYRKDGMVILAQSMIPLENKERFEILKGVNGLQAGGASAGGILNYVVKRPTNEPLRSVTFEVSERGTLYSAIDLGGRSDDKRFGYRINAAAADIKSYVQGSNGDRKFVSGAFDWRLSPKALLQIDMDYHHKSQLTVPGFQLLGGTTIPTGVSGKTMLNNQQWSLPVTDDTNNIGMKFEYELNDNWRTVLQANKFELRRDDAVALASGCPTTLISSGYCADGTFGLYDLRRDNDKRTVMTTQAMLQGKFDTGAIRHDLTVGVSTLNRRDNFANYLFNPADGDGLGSIYYPKYNTITLAQTNPVSLRRKEDERSIFTQDILSLNEKLKLHAGLRYTQLERDQYNATGGLYRHTDKDFVLPSAALVFKPLSNWSVYASYSEGLESGAEVPSPLNNAETILDPSKSKQYEIGVKADLSADLSVAAALFQIKRDHDYANSSFDYVAAGTAVHRGLELSAQGRATRNLVIGASMTALQAFAKDTGEPQIEGKRIGNVPAFKSAFYMDYTVPDMPALKLNAMWIYSSSKIFAPTRDFSAPNVIVRREVDAYNIFNVGAQYKTKVSNTTTTFRLGIDNVFDKFYWADASNAFGGYLIPGAPRVFRLSAQFDF